MVHILKDALDVRAEVTWSQTTQSPSLFRVFVLSPKSCNPPHPLRYLLACTRTAGCMWRVRGLRSASRGPGFAAKDAILSSCWGCVRFGARGSAAPGLCSATRREAPAFGCVAGEDASAWIVTGGEGRSRNATLTRRARARACVAPRAPRAQGAIEARAAALCRGVRARCAGGAILLAFYVGIRRT